MDQEKSSVRIVLYSSLARRDLEGIFEYTLNKWGEEQADRYVHGILDLLTQAAKGEIDGRVLASKKGRRFVRFTWPGSRYSHRIIFQILPHSITVLRIIHSAQKLPSKMQFDRLESVPPDQDPTP